ncbi:DNA translocase FtsK [Georgenia sp. MJ173]|uniref:DNA translocase FtsK n=1 Tax=Georgenia sunbinii TaxID=3117728 RepID=UPI002F2678A8
MTAKMSGRRGGRIELSQRAWTLPDGSPAGWWSLAPGRDPGGDRAAREAAREIPVEHREHAWLRDERGRTWWAVLDTRTGRAAYASTRDDLPAEDVAAAEPLEDAPAAEEPTTEPRAKGVEPAVAESTTAPPVKDVVDTPPAATEPPDDDAEEPAAGTPPAATEPPNDAPKQPEPVEDVTVPDDAPAAEDVATHTTTTEEPPVPTTDHSRALVSALANFDISATVASVIRGATVDRYMLRPGPGVRVAQVAKLYDDLALALDVPHVRVLGASGHVAVEVPATERRTVPLSEISDPLEQDHPLRVPVGLDVEGHGISARLDRLPHLLVAGTTGSGKSTWTTAILAHLVTRAEPARVQLALVDPKRVELAPFAGLAHLWRPVATDVEAAVTVLEEIVVEVDARYERLESAGKRSVEDLDDAPPYLLLVVDELADLMMQGGKRAERSLVRILQIGRAAGVHAILATQRPSADVVNSLIKTNAPSRLTFAVQSHVDSGVALGQSGAEALLGRGDGLWWPSGASQPERIQSPYLSTDDLDEMLAPLKRAQPAEPEDHPFNNIERLKAASRARMEANREAREAGIAAATAPTAEPAPTAETPEEPATYRPVVPTAVAEEPTTELAALGHTARELAMLRAHARELDEGMELAYEKGRRHGALAMELPSHRVMLARDWWVAVAVFLSVALASVLVLPVLVPAAGAWAAWTVARRRTSMAKYRGTMSR